MRIQNIIGAISGAIACLFLTQPIYAHKLPDTKTQAQAQDTTQPEPHIIFVQLAQLATVKPTGKPNWYKITFKKLDSNVEFISDYESPSLGNMPLKSFVKGWGNGPNNFFKGNPHASFIYKDTNSTIPIKDSQ